MTAEGRNFIHIPHKTVEASMNMAKQAHTHRKTIGRHNKQQTQQSFSMKMKMRRQLKLFTCLAS